MTVQGCGVGDIIAGGAGMCTERRRGSGGWSERRERRRGSSEASGGAGEARDSDWRPYAPAAAANLGNAELDGGGGGRRRRRRVSSNGHIHNLPGLPILEA